MKTSTFILALFILLKPITPVVGYLIFYDYIKLELCENKEKIESSCNGKCFLKKQIVQASEVSEKADGKKSFSPTFHFDFFNQNNTSSWYLIIDFISKREQIAFTNKLYSLFSNSSLLRPPIQ